MFKNKIKIYITYFSHVHYMEYQVKSFEKFIDNNYEVIILNNSPDKNMWDKINNEAKRLKLKVLDIPNKNTDHPSASHIYAINWAYQNCIKETNDIVVFLDSDIFFFNNFNFNDYIDGYSICGYPQNKKNKDKTMVIYYFWPGFLILNMKLLKNKDIINFNCGVIKGIPVDTGGYLYEYINAYPNDRYNYISSYTKNIDFLLNQLKLNYENKNNSTIQIFEQSSLHLIAGCNWDNNRNEELKIKFEIIKNLIK